MLLSYESVTGAEPRTESTASEQERFFQVRLGALATDVSIALIRSDTLSNILSRCAEAAVKNLQAAFARIWTLNEKDNVLELQASAGLYTHLDGAHSRIPVRKFKIGKIAEERIPHLSNSVIGDPCVPEQDLANREGKVAFAGDTLRADDRLMGVIAMFARHELGEATLNAMAAIANGIALCILRKNEEKKLLMASEDLEARVQHRTAELTRVNAELCREVEERKRAEDALRQTEQRYRSIFENAVEGMFQTSGSRFVAANPSLARMLGYSRPQELIAGIQDIANQLYVNPEQRAEYIRLLQERGEAWAFECQFFRKDRSRIWVSLYTRALRGDDGKVYFEGTVEDITDRKQ